MRNPLNEAANIIVSAESIIVDLGVQAGEIQAAIGKQQSLIDGLATIAEWEEVTEVEEPIETPILEEEEVD